MEWYTKCCLLVALAVCYGSVCVLSEDRIVKTYNDEVFNDEFDDTEKNEMVQGLIGQYLDDVDAKQTLRDAILDDAIAAEQQAHAYGIAEKRAGRCRAGKCIMRGPNPNTASRVLPFGKRDDSANTLARRVRGPQKNSRARGGRTLLPFGKRR